MVEVTPGIKSPPHTGFSIESIISRDSDPVSRSPLTPVRHPHNNLGSNINTGAAYPQISPSSSASSPSPPIDTLSATPPSGLPGSRTSERVGSSPLSSPGGSGGGGGGLRLTGGSGFGDYPHPHPHHLNHTNPSQHFNHPALNMDVLRSGGAFSAAGLTAHHPHHPHFPVPVSSTHPHLPHHVHSHFLTAAAASDSVVTSLFSGGGLGAGGGGGICSTGGKPHHHPSSLYPGLSGAGGCTGPGGSPGGVSLALAEAGHSAGGLFSPQSLSSAFSGVSPGDASSLSALHALSQKGIPETAALHGLAGGASGLPLHGLHRQFPLYTWLSRPGFFHRYTGSEPSFLLPFRKPKRIRTAFSPSQLLRLEHAFEKNHYVVGQERKELAITLSLTETQVKVWFQNRRTKHKRLKSEEEQETRRDSKDGKDRDSDE